jgi:hypothetical protein
MLDIGDCLLCWSAPAEGRFSTSITGFFIACQLVDNYVILHKVTDYRLASGQSKNVRFWHRTSVLFLQLVKGAAHPGKERRDFAL